MKKKTGTKFKYGNVEYTESQHQEMRYGQDKYGRDLLQPTLGVDRLTRKDKINDDFVREYGNPTRSDESKYEPTVGEDAKYLQGRKKPKPMSERVAEVNQIIERDFTRFFDTTSYCVQSVALLYTGDAKECQVCGALSGNKAEVCWSCTVKIL